MTHALEGATRVYSGTAVSSGAGDTVCGLRPPAGYLWEVLWAVAWQDDGAVAMSWSFVDPGAAYPGTTILSDTAAAANERWIFAQEQAAQPGVVGSGLNAPIILTYDRYLLFHFTASAGSKNSYIRALVKQYQGLSVEQ